NIMVIVDGSLTVRGLVGNPKLKIDDEARPLSLPELFGSAGQIQVVKNHPVWKHPVNSVVSMEDYSIPVNMALYLSQSEQRTGA
ncbi:Hsp33 family molecular chaperone HslO, partial [Acinetobacter baumannii]